MKGFDYTKLRLAVALKRRREDKSIYTAAAESGVAVSTFANFERGDRPQEANIRKLAKWAGVSLDYLQGRERAYVIAGADTLTVIDAALVGDPALTPETVLALSDMMRAAYAAVGCESQR
jgi:transcriptional regulator with XRE-family HTH domain